MRKKLSADYQAGYNAGYTAGRRKADGTPKYRRQGWRCANCKRVGEVLFRSDDDGATRQHRLEISHRAKAKRACLSPDIFPLTKKQTEALAPPVVSPRTET